jgi:hypothetical protein
MTFSEEEIVNLINVIVSAQGASKRIIVWHSRLLKELKRIEGWLRYEQSQLHRQHNETNSRDDC